MPEFPYEEQVQKTTISWTGEYMDRHLAVVNARAGNKVEGMGVHLTAIRWNLPEGNVPEGEKEPGGKAE